MIENIDVNDAIDLFKDKWKTNDIEMTPLHQANNRVLAETLYAKQSLPVVRASSMDGIAIKGDNYQENVSNWVLRKDYVRADTGDDFSDEFDTVIAIENVDLKVNSISWKGKIEFEKGMNIRPSGSLIEKDTLLLEKGSRISPTNLSLLAMGNHLEISVYKKPRVVFIPTGSELVKLGDSINRGQNVDSNSVMVKALLEEFGAEAVIYPIAKDDPKLLKISIDKALGEGDIVLINGGSSKGEQDFSLRFLEQEGKVYFHWAQCGPGRPVALGKLKNKAVFVLPGPSYGCFNVMQWLINPCIRHLTGDTDTYRYKVKAKLKAPIKAPTHFKFLLGADVEKTENGELLVTLLSFKEHGLSGCLRANGFVHTSPDMELSCVGSEIEVTLIKQVE